MDFVHLKKKNFKSTDISHAILYSLHVYFFQYTMLSDFEDDCQEIVMLPVLTLKKTNKQTKCPSSCNTGRQQRKIGLGGGICLRQES